MAKKTNQEEELFVDVEEVYGKTETFIDENKNTIVSVVVGIIVVIGGYFAYSNFVAAPNEKEAKEMMFMAEQYFQQDSLNKAIYGDGVNMGFLEIEDNYGSTKAGNLANYYLGISYLRSGQFESAISSLQDFSSSDVMLSAIALGAQGDAYMELGDKSKAASFYSKAAKANANDFTSPIYLMKAGMAYEAIGEYNDALKAFKTIKKDYSKTQEGAEVEKYIARIETYIN